MKSYRKIFTYARLTALVFIVIILIGAVLLSLPFSNKSCEYTPFIDSLFTSASATCVTGLVIYDTAEHWSVFGKIVILCLIQIGGLGFMSIVTMFAVAMKKNISLENRKLLMQSSGSLQIGGMILLLKKIIIGTFAIELTGAVLLCLYFCPSYGINGIGMSLFHSISAFCNAGFDVMEGEFTSMTSCRDNMLVNLVLMSLIIIGGLGFIVWDDVIRKKFSFHKYRLHTKIVLTTTFILIVAGSLLFWFFEKNNLLKDIGFKNSILASLFASVSPRTAGFNTLPLDKMSDSSVILNYILMLIGGSPGSTAGGMKTTTAAALFAGIMSSAKQSDTTVIFKRRLENEIIHQAAVIFALYVSIVAISSMFICMLSNQPLAEVAFETVSAVATTGLSMGITPKLDFISKIILTLLMYGGRVGILTIMVAFYQRRNITTQRPAEKILLG